jgi:hypothetical protein
MKTFAERELDILKGFYVNSDEESLLEPYREEILAIVKKFKAVRDQSGSRPYIAGSLARAIDKLCLGEPITPLTGAPDEWSHCDTGFYLNKRTNLVSKHDMHPLPVYENAIIWDAGESRMIGIAFREDGTKVTSKQYIKSFPCELVTFFVRVRLVKMTDSEGYCYQVIDDFELNRALEYYQEFPPLKEES